MPELPFIQVLVENLAREIEGHTIVSVRVPSPAIVKTFDPPVSALAGRRIERVRRIGKLIVSDLSDDLLLVMHLMRDGRLQIARAGSAARKGRASPAPKPMAFGLFLEGGDELRVNEAGPKKRAGVYVLRAQDAASSEPRNVADLVNIGASLGKDSIHNSITAGIIAVLLVVIIMIGYYRFSGLLAVLGLTLYMLYTLAALAGFSAVLTLPGLAGFVLSIGIAVDANVLIFERIREELDRGKTVRTSIDEGFRHAMSAIIDSNVSTALTAAILYQYGTGPVRGFAVTLLAGIAASMVTSIFVVRTFYMIWLTRARDAQTLSI